MERNVLVITNDVVGDSMAGPGIRALEIARQLAEEFPVVLAAPEQPSPHLGKFRTLGHQSSPGAMRRAAMDSRVIVVQGPVLDIHPWIGHIGAPIVADLYDPVQLERLHMVRTLPVRHQSIQHGWAQKSVRRQLIAGDFFVCASERQRHFWLGMLSAVDRVNPRWYGIDPTLRRLIDVVPFGVPTTPPEHSRRVLKGVYPGIESDDQVVLWSGGLWDWLDPRTLIDAMAHLKATRPRVKALFMGTKRPGVPETGRNTLDQTVQRARDLGLYDSTVFFNDWVAYDDRQNFLLESDVGISLGLDHIESTFAFRTRILDCIWSGLPMICTRGDVTADLVEQYGLGLAVPPEDSRAVSQALQQLLDEPAPRESRQPAFKRAAAEFSWQRVVTPLRRFVEAPSFAPDYRLGQPLGQLRRAQESFAWRLSRWVQRAQSVRMSYDTGGPHQVKRDVARFLAR